MVFYPILASNMRFTRSSMLLTHYTTKFNLINQHCIVLVDFRSFVQKWG